MVLLLLNEEYLAGFLLLQPVVAGFQGKTGGWFYSFMIR